MAQTTTWKINDMVRDDATGGVKTVYWECHVSDNTHTECSATEGGLFVQIKILIYHQKLTAGVPLRLFLIQMQVKQH